MSFPLSEVSIAICALFVAYCWHWLRSRYRLVLPPGPRGLPLLGNLLQLPSADAFPWLVYRAWSSEYSTFTVTCPTRRLLDNLHHQDSDVVRFRAFGTNILILNSLDAITELLEKRSSVTSDRFVPQMVLAQVA